MSGMCKTLAARREGQSMVEFALILPLMVLFVAGIFDLGRAFFADITITNAAREGARYGVLNHDDSQGICNASFKEAQSSNITLDYSKITISCGCCTITCVEPTLTNPNPTDSIDCSANQPIDVTVGYNYNDMIFKFFFPDPIFMNKRVEMLVP